MEIGHHHYQSLLHCQSQTMTAQILTLFDFCFICFIETWRDIYSPFVEINRYIFFIDENYYSLALSELFTSPFSFVLKILLSEVILTLGGTVQYCTMHVHDNFTAGAVLWLMLWARLFIAIAIALPLPLMYLRHS